MARYKDIDEILKTLPDDLPYKASVKRVLIQAPTADVVPKSEYDCLEKLFNDMTQEAKGYLNKLYGIRAEVAREIEKELLIAIDKLLDQTEGHTRDIHSTTYNAVKSFIRDRVNEYEVNLYKDNQSNKE